MMRFGDYSYSLNKYVSKTKMLTFGGTTKY
jgi:hypothetical protein